MARPGLPAIAVAGSFAAVPGSTLPGTSALPAAADLPESIHSRSVTLSSERLKVIAKLRQEEGGGLRLDFDDQALFS